MSGQRALLICTLLLGVLLAVAWPHLPQVDLPGYFSFVDRQSFLQVPNFLNVITNLPFAIVGFLILTIKPSKDLDEMSSQILKFLGISMVFVALGSTYFHLWPDAKTVFWDRVPITYSLVAIISLVIGDRMSQRFSQRFFYSLLAVATLCLALYGAEVADLRIYACLQYGGILFVLAFASMTKSKLFETYRLWITVALYGAAKAFEMLDQKIAEHLFCGGHPIKHVIAAVAIYYFVQYVRNEKPNVATP